MSMTARLKRFVTDDDWDGIDLLSGERPVGTGEICVQTGVTDGPPPRQRNGLVVECQLVHPPSAAGKPVYLFLTDQDVTDLLLELRASAIEARK